MPTVVLPQNPNDIRAPIESEHNGIRDAREKQYIHDRNQLEATFHSDLATIETDRIAGYADASLMPNGGPPNNINNWGVGLAGRNPIDVRGEVDAEWNELRAAREKQYVDDQVALEQDYHSDLVDIRSAKEDALVAAGLNPDGSTPSNYTPS